MAMVEIALILVLFAGEGSTGRRQRGRNDRDCLMKIHQTGEFAAFFRAADAFIPAHVHDNACFRPAWQPQGDPRPEYE